MTITPFLALNLRRKKDAILARQRARRVASLLSFDCHEQACIAAGAFVIACQALEKFGKARLCFQIDAHQLQVFAEDANPASALESGVSKRLTGLFSEPDDAKALYRLAKPMPPQQNPAEEVEIGWVVAKVEETACAGIFDEIVKQNQEMLTLLHELRLYRGEVFEKEEKSANPHAA
jgi:hypothetical protein